MRLSAKNLTFKDNFLENISHNCGKRSMHTFWNDLSNILKLFENMNVSNSMDNGVTFVYSTVAINKVIDNDLNISNDDFFLNLNENQTSSAELHG